MELYAQCTSNTESLIAHVLSTKNQFCFVREFESFPVHLKHPESEGKIGKNPGIYGNNRRPSSFFLTRMDFCSNGRSYQLCTKTNTENRSSFRHPFPDNLLFFLQPRVLFLVIDTHRAAKDKKMRRMKWKNFISFIDRNMKNIHPALPDIFLKQTAVFIPYMLENSDFPLVHTLKDQINLLA